MVRHILAKFSTSLLKFRLPVTSPIQMVHFFFKKKYNTDGVEKFIISCSKYFIMNEHS